MFINLDNYVIKGLSITTQDYDQSMIGLFYSVAGSLLYGIDLIDVNIDVLDDDIDYYNLQGAVA